MDEYSREIVRNIKFKIIAMLDERQRLEHGNVTTATPSKYWSDVCSFSDYMLGLPEESFSKLRLHTYHLTGDNYQNYYFGDAEAFKPLWKEEIRDIPSDYILHEPAGGIGFDFGNGRLISRDILRYQHIVNTLYRYGIMSSLAKVNGGPKLILEIGAGYGGLIHHLSNMLPNTTYVLLDLPETLLFSASYLSLLNPEKKMYIYQPSDTDEAIQSAVVNRQDFVLAPNYRLDYLRRLRFDLVINVASLVEMRTDQVNTYLDFIAQTCRGVFYSWNEDARLQNKEMENLTEMIETRFTLTEVLPRQPTEKLTVKERAKRKLRQMLKSAVISVGIYDRPKPVSKAPYQTSHEYICKPLASAKRSQETGNP
jgi:SAM-dependent methyltransferase